MNNGIRDSRDPRYQDEYPDPETALKTHDPAAATARDEYPAPEEVNPSCLVPPPRQQEMGQNHLQGSPPAGKKASRIGQQFSQKVSKRVPEWAASTRKYGADFNQRSADQAYGLSTKANEAWRNADAKSRKQVWGRPVAVVWAQGILLGAALVAFLGTFGTSDRLLGLPRSWANWLTHQDTRYVSTVHEGIAAGAARAEEYAALAEQGLTMVPFLVAGSVLLLYLLAIFGMWHRMPRARALSCVLAVVGVLLAMIVGGPHMRVLFPFYAQGLFALAAFLGAAAMCLMLMPATNSWVAEKRCFRQGPDYSELSLGATDTGGPQPAEVNRLAPAPRKPARSEDY